MRVLLPLARGTVLTHGTCVMRAKQKRLGGERVNVRSKGSRLRKKGCIAHGELDRVFLRVEGGDKNHQGVLHRQPP
jgi:hypothetical protein